MYQVESIQSKQELEMRMEILQHQVSVLQSKRDHQDAEISALKRQLADYQQDHADKALLGEAWNISHLAMMIEERSF